MYKQSFLSTLFKIVITLFLTVGLLTSITPAAKADTMSDMQTQLSTLLEQLLQLQSQLATLSTASPLTAANLENARFPYGSRIITATSTNIRATSSASSALLAEEQTGSTGTILAGPVVGPRFTWYKVHYDNGVVGWNRAFVLRSFGDTLPAVPTTTTSTNHSSTTIPVLAIGSKIIVENAYAIRASSSITARFIGKQAVGVIGTVKAGPIYREGFTWYNVDYATGPDGWNRVVAIHKNSTTTNATSTTPTPAKPFVEHIVTCGSAVVAFGNFDLYSGPSSTSTFTGLQLTDGTISNNVVSSVTKANGEVWFKIYNPAYRTQGGHDGENHPALDGWMTINSFSPYGSQSIMSVSSSSKPCPSKKQPATVYYIYPNVSDGMTNTANCPAYSGNCNDHMGRSNTSSGSTGSAGTSGSTNTGSTAGTNTGSNAGTSAGSSYGGSSSNGLGGSTGPHGHDYTGLSGFTSDGHGTLGT